MKHVTFLLDSQSFAALEKLVYKLRGFDQIKI